MHINVAPAESSGIVLTSAERKELTTKTRKTKPMNVNTDTKSINSTKPNPNDGVVII